MLQRCWAELPGDGALPPRLGLSLNKAAEVLIGAQHTNQNVRKRMAVGG